MLLARQLLAVLVLPFSMTVVVPWWLWHAFAASDTRWGTVASAWIGRVAGASIGAVGLALFAACVWLFTRVGRGTLAPWDPTRRLVAVGPYRYVRNPMISGVAAMLVGETAITGSRVLAGLCIVFVAVNHVYFLLSEEPGLHRRFGDDYVRYARAVRRWVPRATPWRDTQP